MIAAEIPECVRAKAAFYNLDPELIAAVICQESEGNQWAHRVEDHYYDSKLVSRPLAMLPGTVSTLASHNTERRDRAASWGPMQVLGETAREMGFTGQFLTELCDIEVGIEYGCKYLAHCLELADGDVPAALLRYNGGGNPDYPAEVLSHRGTELWLSVLG